MRGVPFIVSAPSGTGKTTLCRMAVEFFPELRHSISYTTRGPRPGEVDGVDYRFVEDSVFDRMAREGEFLEHAVVHGKRYGTSRKDLEELLARGIDVILDIDVQGAEKARSKLKGAVYIFILPPSIEACRERLLQRGKDSPEVIEKRLGIAREEIKKALLYEYIIINDSLEDAFERLRSIILAEKSKTRETAEAAPPGVISAAGKCRKEAMIERVRKIFPGLDTA